MFCKLVATTSPQSFSTLRQTKSKRTPARNSTLLTQCRVFDLCFVWFCGHVTDSILKTKRHLPFQNLHAKWDRKFDQTKGRPKESQMNRSPEGALPHCEFVFGPEWAPLWTRAVWGIPVETLILGFFLCWNMSAIFALGNYFALITASLHHHHHHHHRMHAWCYLIFGNGMVKTTTAVINVVLTIVAIFVGNIISLYTRYDFSIYIMTFMNEMIVIVHIPVCTMVQAMIRHVHPWGNTAKPLWGFQGDLGFRPGFRMFQEPCLSQMEWNCWRIGGTLEFSFLKCRFRSVASAHGDSERPISAPDQFFPDGMREQRKCIAVVSIHLFHLLPG